VDVDGAAVETGSSAFVVDGAAVETRCLAFVVVAVVAATLVLAHVKGTLVRLLVTFLVLAWFCKILLLIFVL
jgi:hypothetical protein